MKILLIALYIAAIALIPVQQAQAGWATNGVFPSPGPVTLADTGPIVLGSRNQTVIIQTSTSTVIEIAQRNAANTEDIGLQQMILAGELRIFQLSLTILPNQRLVIR